jgi:hypothetical protein
MHVYILFMPSLENKTGSQRNFFCRKIGFVRRAMLSKTFVAAAFAILKPLTSRRQGPELRPPATIPIA